MWRVFTVENKPGWWRKRPIHVPQLEHSWWRKLHSAADHYQWLRVAHVAFDCLHHDSNYLGEDNFVVAYSMPQPGAPGIHKMTRRVLYLGVQAGEGIYLPPDGEVAAWHGGPIRMRQPTRKQIAECEAHRLAYLAMLTARAAGRTIQVGHEWITPVEQERRWQVEETARKLYRQATGR